GAPVVCEKYDSCEDYESCVSEQEYSTVYCSGNNNGFDAICEAKVSTNKLFAHADPPALKTKSKKKARLFGCGLPLPKIFSKSLKSKGASKCSDLTPRPGDHMISVIGLQQLHGQWNVSDQLLQLLSVTKEDVVDKLTFSKDSSVVCTVLVLAWLRKQFSHRQEEWQMIEAKALVWISTQSPSFTTEEHIKHTTEMMWAK
ncbi:von Willebrand factor A domain-containing protein 5A-like, partial [Ruditapes philippinarum]|uniref:von Willebrand factor A domain-containing protein 5A-like n=1 Tax=Ruditapes philippinarum TaxID=129788 RepID=UPI00295BC137